MNGTIVAVLIGGPRHGDVLGLPTDLERVYIPEPTRPETYLAQCSALRAGVEFEVATSTYRKRRGPIRIAGALDL